MRIRYWIYQILFKHLIDSLFFNLIRTNMTNELNAAVAKDILPFSTPVIISVENSMSLELVM